MMRWTQEEIDSFNVEQQIEALRRVQVLTEKLTKYRVRNEEITKKLKALERKVDLVRNGLPKHLVGGAAVLVLLIVEFLTNFLLTIVICAILFCAYSSFYGTEKAGRREEIAQGIFNKTGPSLLNEQQQIIHELEIFARSDDGYNASLLLPDEFLYPEKVQALINILSSRGARNIAEAMEVYNKNSV